MKIAFLASPVTMPGSPTRRPDFIEHDAQVAALAGPLAARGLELVPISWDAEADWSNFGAAVIGTTWDYWDRADDFLTRLEAIEVQMPLFNPVATVRWNMRKTYLRDMEARGARLIPTLWLDAPDDASIAGAFAALDCDDIVVKRQVGAGAFGQHRLKRGDVVPPLPHAVMVQPFQSAIASEGEYSFLFCGGVFSHALVKRAKPGDYRIQSLYGGVNAPVEPPAADLNAAWAVMDSLPEVPLYARVDMVRGEDGGLLLMELEMIEPYLYPLEGPQLGELYAQALAKRL